MSSLRAKLVFDLSLEIDAEPYTCSSWPRRGKRMLRVDVEWTRIIRVVAVIPDAVEDILDKPADAPVVRANWRRLPSMSI